MPNDPSDVTTALVEVAATSTGCSAAQGPRVVVIDDLQWLDPSSVGMVDLVVERAARHPLVVLAAARPGPLPDWA